MSDKVLLTHARLLEMEQELNQLKTVTRKEIAQKIKEARAQGDLSENAEYDAAKEQQGEIETRIAELEKLLRNAEVIDEAPTLAHLLGQKMPQAEGRVLTELLRV